MVNFIRVRSKQIHDHPQRERDTEEGRVMDKDDVIELSRSKKRKKMDKSGHATQRKKLEICIPKFIKG